MDCKGRVQLRIVTSGDHVFIAAETESITGLSGGFHWHGYGWIARGVSNYVLSLLESTFSLQPKQRALQDMTYRDSLTSEGVFYRCSYVLMHLRTRTFALQKVELHHSPHLLAIHLYKLFVFHHPLKALPLAWGTTGACLGIPPGDLGISNNA